MGAMGAMPPGMIRLAVSVLPVGKDVLVLGLKMLLDQLSIDVAQRMRTNALGHVELLEFEHDLDAVPAKRSTGIIGSRRVTASLGATQTIADIETEPNVVDNNFVNELL